MEITTSIKTLTTSTKTFHHSCPTGFQMHFWKGAMWGVGWLQLHGIWSHGMVPREGETWLNWFAWEMHSLFFSLKACLKDHVKKNFFHEPFSFTSSCIKGKKYVQKLGKFFKNKLALVIWKKIAQNLFLIPTIFKYQRKADQTNKHSEIIQYVTS